MRGSLVELGIMFTRFRQMDRNLSDSVPIGGWGCGCLTHSKTEDSDLFMLKFDCLCLGLIGCKQFESENQEEIE
jgi:hypothetical protein